MAHRFLFPSAAALGAGLAYQSATRNPLLFRPTTYHCESPISGMLPSFPGSSTKQRAPKPREHSTFDPTVYRQISTGSFFGVALGLLVVRFGKAITVIVAALMLLAETMARRGIDIVPAGSTVRKWIGNVDITGLLAKNSAFKASFGASFLVAAVYCK